MRNVGSLAAMPQFSQIKLIPKNTGRASSNVGTATTAHTKRLAWYTLAPSRGPNGIRLNPAKIRLMKNAYRTAAMDR